MNPSDFCDPDSGFDYAFTKMHGIYGSAFEHAWRNVDAAVVRQTWKEICGRGLTYRPKIDYAIAHMSPERPPSALAFARLLIDGPSIPTKLKIENKKEIDPKIVMDAKRKVDEVLRKLKAPK